MTANRVCIDLTGTHHPTPYGFRAIFNTNGDFSKSLAAAPQFSTETLDNTWISLPVSDFKPPDAAYTLEFWSALASDISDIMDSGRSVVVFCQGGHGRTGTVAAILAKLLVPNIADPVKYIRDVYCNECVETEKQHNYVNELFGLPKCDPTEYKSAAAVWNYGGYSSAYWGDDWDNHYTKSPEWCYSDSQIYEMLVKQGIKTEHLENRVKVWLTDEKPYLVNALNSTEKKITTHLITPLGHATLDSGPEVYLADLVKSSEPQDMPIVDGNQKNLDDVEYLLEVLDELDIAYEHYKTYNTIWVTLREGMHKRELEDILGYDMILVGGQRVTADDLLTNEEEDDLNEEVANA